MYKEAKNCRICGNDNLVLVMDIGEQALTGMFPKTRDESVLSGPVELVRCAGDDFCGLVQLRQSYDVELMYGDNYGYRSGLNQSMVDHLTNKVQDILAKDILRDGDLVVDIGSNDGTSLGVYPPGKYSLLGCVCVCVCVCMCLYVCIYLPGAVELESLAESEVLKKL